MKKSKSVAIVFERKNGDSSLNKYFGLLNEENKRNLDPFLNFVKKKKEKRSFLSFLKTDLFGESSTYFNTINIKLLFDDEYKNSENTYDKVFLFKEDGSLNFDYFKSKIISLSCHKPLKAIILNTDYSLEYVENKVEDFIEETFYKNYLKGNNIKTFIGFDMEVLKKYANNYFENSYMKLDIKILQLKEEVKKLENLKQTYSRLLIL